MDNSQHIALRMHAVQSQLPTPARRRKRGVERRLDCPRSALARLDPPPAGRDPIALLQHADKGRLRDLLPIRYGRMAVSPFAFLRGAVAVMMEDIGRLPHSGIATQLCGDCHIRNFGAFDSPGLGLLFGINDFDQTGPGPFEWDVKRLGASIVVAAREQGIAEKRASEAALAAARSYRRRIAEFAAMRTLDIWSFRIEARALVDIAGDARLRRERQQLIDAAAARSPAKTLRKLARVSAGEVRIRDRPPHIYHLDGVAHFADEVRDFLGSYLATLPAERQVLLGRFQLADVAAKVTGVGSVGLRCAIALLLAGPEEALFLQLKEARPSVLARYFPSASIRNEGLRVVTGQHSMQSVADPFLGWFRDPGLKADFYVRRYDDIKFSLDSTGFSATDFIDYAQVCGWELARAHARAGDAAVIAGYLGRGDAFDKAIARFAADYADRTESDFRLFAAAIRAGTIDAVPAEA